MKAYRQSILLLILALSTLLPALAKEIDMSAYIRNQQGQVQTSIVTMKNDRGQRLDLISAVHIASSEYYNELNRRFRNYDAVCYELVLPDEMVGQRLPSQMDTGSGLSSLQGLLAKSMGLSSQLERIDYSPANFVHADLTHTGLSQKMSERQESMMTYMMTLMGSSNLPDLNQLGVTEKELSQLDLMAIMSGQASLNDQRILRKLVGSVLVASGGALSGLGDSALLRERNHHALSVIDREQKKGLRQIALFYGAAHMPDLEAQLEKRGWKRTSVDWISAWENI